MEFQQRGLVENRVGMAPGIATEGDRRRAKRWPRRDGQDTFRLL